MKLLLLLFCFLCAFLIYDADSAKILVVYPMAGRSHYILGNSLAKGLAEAGHDITMLSPFTEKNPPKKGSWREIELTGFLDIQKDNEDLNNIFTLADINPVFFIFFLNHMGHLITNLTLSHPNVQKLLHSKTEHFDLVIVEQFNNDAMKAFGHHFNAPVVVVSSIGANGWVNYFVANPAPPSYVPEIMLSFSEHMTFLERLQNTLYANLMEINRQLIFFPSQEKLMKQYFPNPPDFYEMIYNPDLILLNSHISTHHAKPHVPKMVEIGGYHVFPPKKLPKDLQDFLDNAKEGVIYFSMGSNLKSAMMPEKQRNAILNTFKKLKYKILWKWEEDNMPNKPKNVETRKWLPQQDILAHPNIKLFITHGGLLSTTETIYHGVPVLALPIFGDQKLNAAQNERSGFGLTLDFNSLTEEQLTKALNELLSNPKYMENAKKRSKIFHDRQVKPMDNAVYWIEYVIRHKGDHTYPKDSCTQQSWDTRCSSPPPLPLQMVPRLLLLSCG